MSIQSRIYRNLTDELKSILLTSEGWLIGSAIENIKEDKKVTDYDIIVPSRELFQVVTKQLATQFTGNINSFGGLKFTNQEISIDIWCEELDHFLKNCNYIVYIFNMKKNILLKKEI